MQTVYEISISIFGPSVFEQSLHFKGLIYDPPFWHTLLEYTYK